MTADHRGSRAALIDLAAEGEYLDDIVARDEVDLGADTPAAGWQIRDHIGHLLWTDRVTRLACRDRAAFARQAEALGVDPRRTMNAAAKFEAGRPAEELLTDWRRMRADLLRVLALLPPAARIPWFGPSMDILEVTSGRIMETWAHGLDITDALGLPPAATHRLRHIAELGVQTRDYPFSVNGSRSPGSPFRIELLAPDGDRWTWGPADAGDRIIGSALDFCLLVTQRRHRDDLDLTPTPGAADDWMNIAQVFAGPAGTGRKSRQSA